jgi:hypothetical protein
LVRCRCVRAIIDLRSGPVRVVVRVGRFHVRCRTTMDNVGEGAERRQGDIGGVTLKTRDVNVKIVGDVGMVDQADRMHRCGGGRVNSVVSITWDIIDVSVSIVTLVED